MLRVHYVNVGQGDGTLWELPDGSILVYDCGPAAPSSATNPLTVYLRDVLGRPFGGTLWGLVASHGHLDHVGGCEEVFQEYVVEHVYDVWYQGSDQPQSYQSFRTQVRNEGAALHVLLEDSTLAGEQAFHQWDALPVPETAGVNVQIVWPPSFQGNDWGDIARNSLVLRATYGNVDYCFQGDLETSQESTLAGYTGLGDCEVYLVGHHGSRYASSTPWLAKLDPEYAVVSFGINSYGHPTSEALCRVQTSGAHVWATHRAGTITVQTDGTNITVHPVGGESLDYCQPGTNYWTGSTGGGSSGTSGVNITQVQYDAPGADSGANLVEEWVQLTNEGSTSADLSGWTLSDVAGATYAFPNAFTLGTGASVKVRTGSGTNTATDLHWGRGSAVWNNDHDTATLSDSDGQAVDTDSW